MEKYLSTDLIVDILNDEPVHFVYQSIGTKISIDLLKGAKSLSYIHACLAYYFGVLLEGFSAELDELSSLVVKHHLVCSTFPVTSDKYVVLCRLKSAVYSYYFIVGVLASDPTIAIAAVSCYHHQPCPNILVPVIPIVLPILLNQAQATMARPLSDCEFPQRSSILGLFEDASQRIDGVIHPHHLDSLEKLAYLPEVNNYIALLGRINDSQPYIKIKICVRIQLTILTQGISLFGKQGWVDWACGQYQRLRVQNSASKFELVSILPQVKLLKLCSCQLEQNILHCVFQKALVAIVYFGESFLNQERPNLYLPICVFLYTQKGRNVSFLCLHYRNIIIHNYVFPDSIVIYPQVVNTQSKHSLLLHHSLKTSLTV